MKYIFLFFFLCPFLASSQEPFDIDPNTGRIIFQKVVEDNSGTSAKAMLAKSRQWMVANFENPGESVDMDGTLTTICRGRSTMPIKRGLGVIYIDADYLVKIENREGRARITITDIYLEQEVHGSTARQEAKVSLLSKGRSKGQKELRSESNLLFTGILDDFNGFMLAAVGDEDW